MTKIVYEDFPGNTTEYPVNFEYLSRADVYVSSITEEEELIEILTDWIWKDDTTIQFSTPPGGIIRVFRSTDIDEPISVFYPTVAIRAIDLNNNFDQLVFSLQEERQNLIDLNVDIDNIEDDLEQLTEIIVNTIQFVPVENVAELNAAALTDPDDLKGYEIRDSTDIDTLASPVILNLPPAAGSNPGEDPINGVYWNSGIVTRVFWVKAEQLWKFILYYTGDADNRYQQTTLANAVTPDPADYKDGTLWFDASDANLYVLYNDGNSRQWVITNPLSAYGQIVTSDDVYWARDAATNTVYPKQSTDNIATNNRSAVISSDGNITLGTDKITLDAANGKSYFSDNLQTSYGGISVNVNGAQDVGVFAGAGGVVTVTSTDGSRSVALRGFKKGSTSQNWGIYSNGDIVSSGYISSKAYLYMGPNGSADPNITLDATDGSASFAGFVDIGSSSFTAIGEQITNNSDTLPCLWLQNYASPGPLLKGVSSGGETVEINNDGSAIFAGTVKQGTFNGGQTTTDGSVFLDNGGVYTQILPSSTSDLYRGYKGSSLVFKVEDDGNATFAGSVVAGDVPGVSDNVGSKLSNTGFLSVSRASGGAVLNVYKTGDATKQIELKSDGSAEFKSQVRVQRVTGDNCFLAGDANSVNNARITSDGKASFAKQVLVHQSSGNDLDFNYIGQNNANATTFSVRANGNASFGGSLDVASYCNFNYDGVSNERVSVGKYAPAGNATALIGYDSADTAQFVLNAVDGSANFAGDRFAIATNGSIEIYRSAGDANSDLQTWSSDIGATKKINARIKADGSAIFKGTVQTAGGVVTPSMVLQLEADDDTKYTATTDNEGNETRVYNGEVLDVKALLLTLRTAAARITTLEAEVQALKSTIPTSSQEV